MDALGKVEPVRAAFKSKKLVLVKVARIRQPIRRKIFKRRSGEIKAQNYFRASMVRMKR
jgi:hypothetical protein